MTLPRLSIVNSFKIPQTFIFLPEYKARAVLTHNLKPSVSDHRSRLGTVRSLTSVISLYVHYLIPNILVPYLSVHCSAVTISLLLRNLLAAINCTPIIHFKLLYGYTKISCSTNGWKNAYLKVMRVHFSLKRFTFRTSKTRQFSSDNVIVNRITCC